jgi:hypothetical protein
MSSEYDVESELPITPVHPREERRQTGRVEAFSDGVFAVAITLLIVSVPVPNLASKDDLFRNVLDNAGWALAAYTISFATILIMWVNHHTLFTQVSRVDRPFMIFNGLLLMLVCFLWDVLQGIPRRGALRVAALTLPPGRWWCQGWGWWA